MSQSVYKGQKYVELLSTTNKGLLSKWKVLPSVKKNYDESLKTFVYTLNGKSPIPLMRWTKDKTMDLDHPILVFQIYLAVDASILFHIGVRCCSGIQKRITLSTQQKSECVSTLFSIVPLSFGHAGEWCHLVVDLEGVLSAAWKRELFRGISSVCLGGSCRIRRIFTLKKDMLHSQQGRCCIKYDQMPRHMLLSKTYFPTYQIIFRPVDSEKKDSTLPIPSTGDKSIYYASSSCSSGSFKPARKGQCSRQSKPKSVKSSGSLSEQNVLNQERCFSSEDGANSVIPFLSELSFAGTSSKSAETVISDTPEDEEGNYFLNVEKL